MAEMRNTAFEKLCNKIRKEQAAYVNRLLVRTPEDILDHAGEYRFREDLAYILEEGQAGLTDKQMETLCEQDGLLDTLCEYLDKVDYSIVNMQMARLWERLGGSTGNTKIEFLYRDADNYKIWNTAVVKGSLSDAQVDEIMSCLIDGEHFIPDMVGLDGECYSGTEADTELFELNREGFSNTTLKPKNSNVTAEQLVENFKTAKALKWGGQGY